LPQQVVQRAKIILLAAAGIIIQEIARRLRITRPTLQLWRQCFFALRLPGLEKDAACPGRISRISASKVRPAVEATLHTRPLQGTRAITTTLRRRLEALETPGEQSLFATVIQVWCASVRSAGMSH
jgi:hypothetical protein